MLSLLSKHVLRSLRVIKWIFPASHYALLSVLFIVGLELIFIIQRWVIVESVVVIMLVIIGILLIRREERGVFHPIHTILPILATTGLTGFAFLLPTMAILHVYIGLAGLVFFFILKHGVKSAYPVWSWLLAMVTFFLNISFILGLRFHIHIPVIVILAATMAISGLILLQSLRRVSETIYQVLLPVLGMSLVLTEVVWVILFLPIHWLVQASVVTALYYVLFNLVCIAMSRKVARKDFLEYLGLGFVALLIVLLSAQWK